uniref:Uncharacterized protein n=1 Tax=Trypanosoma congolense (strain IL3000) TaxID=1068625 RepID=G0UPI6_TRYCI|nr:hypothetical protein, unlikely [Trypanosoma congolense IL3000]
MRFETKGSYNGTQTTLISFLQNCSLTNTSVGRKGVEKNKIKHEIPPSALISTRTYATAATFRSQSIKQTTQADACQWTSRPLPHTLLLPYVQQSFFFTLSFFFLSNNR